jgi:hypothetical protein
MYRRPDVFLHIFVLVGLLCASCGPNGEDQGGGQPDPTWFDLDGTWLNVVHSPQHRVFGGRYCFGPGSEVDQLDVQCTYGVLRTRYIEPTFGALVYDGRGLGANCELRSGLTTEVRLRVGDSRGTLNVQSDGTVLLEDRAVLLSGEFRDVGYYLRCQLRSPRVMECVDEPYLDSGEAPLDDRVYRFEKMDSLPSTITCERVLHDFITSGGVLE